LKLRSNNNIVIAAANTGKANINKNDVTNIDHKYNGKLCKNIDSSLKNIIVQIKFIDDNIDDTPTICKLNITKSTDIFGCPTIDDNGG
jgi:hypothetical protein